MGVGGIVYHGHDGLRKWHRDLSDVWDPTSFRVEIEAYFDLGEHTLTFNVLHGRGSKSGVEVERSEALVGKWRDGLCVYFKVYPQREDALKDLGVSEEALEPIAP
jgi:hypothetical protein